MDSNPSNSFKKYWRGAANNQSHGNSTGTREDDATLDVNPEICSKCKTNVGLTTPAGYGLVCFLGGGGLNLKRSKIFKLTLALICGGVGIGLQLYCSMLRQMLTVLQN